MSMRATVAIALCLLVSGCAPKPHWYVSDLRCPPWTRPFALDNPAPSLKYASIIGDDERTEMMIPMPGYSITKFCLPLSASVVLFGDVK